jgi:2-methylisocitrate lyase-like PEP mutase family enzyme
VADHVRAAMQTGLAGGSIEDYTGRADEPLYGAEAAAERVRAAAEAAHSGPGDFVLTARADGYLHGRADLAEVIARLQAFHEAGADVLYAPGLRDLAELRTVIASVDRPVNVLVLPGGPPAGAVAEAGAARVSIGGALTYAAYAFAMDAAKEFLGGATNTALDGVGPVVGAIRSAFTR